MKYLDEQIEGNYFSISPKSAGIYGYSVVRLKPDYSTIGDSTTYDTIFIGSFYHPGGRNINVDITEIIRNDVWVPTEDLLYYSTTETSTNIHLVNTYYVRFELVTGLFSNSSPIQVAKVYRYPHQIAEMNSNVFFDYSINNNVSFPLQGRYTVGGYGQYHLPPHYPYIGTDQYRLILTSENSLNVTTGTANFSGGLNGSFSVKYAPPSSYTTYALEDLYDYSTTDDDYYVTYTTYASPIGDYSFSYNNPNHILYVAPNDYYSSCYCQLVVSDVDEPIIARRLSGWTELNTSFDSLFIVDLDFLEANSENLIYIIFTHLEDPTSTIVFDYDWIKINFDFGLHASEMIGKTIRVQGLFTKIDKEEFDLTNLRVTDILNPNLLTRLEISGDYVAVIDLACHSRYYLQWQDRMGGFQSQAFTDKLTYSEKFSNETISNYRGEKRPSLIEVLSSIKLESGWIDEKIFPYYESIFTSPVLFLYDTVEDKRYTVIVKDTEYTEKNYTNQKKLINLSLNLELNKKQTLIY